MINHIGKYNDAQAIQDALDAGTLANPYVAMTSAGTIDYNSLQPTPPAPATMGVWSDDGQGVYTFHVTETDMQYWEGADVYIGALQGVYYSYGQDPSSPIDMNILIQYFDFGGGAGGWQATFFDNISMSSEMAGLRESEAWTSQDIVTNLDSSEGHIQAEWNGSDTITFSSLDADAPLSINTYNPPYPEESGE